MKILSIIGTRPEAIKMAPIIQELNHHQDQIVSKVCVTGQHRAILDQVLRLFKIEPDYDLNVMRDGQTPSEVAYKVLASLEPVLNRENPDWVLVQGDTTSAMSSAISAFYSRIRLGHVEAGLRTNDKWQPFPEEINRRIISVVSDLHFAPTQWALQNLVKEGVLESQILVTGNPVIDSLKWVVNQYPSIVGKKKKGYPTYYPLDITDNVKIILLTAHRRENFGQPIENICLAIRKIAELYSEKVQIIYPVHPNPNINGPVYKLLKGVRNIVLIPPLDYIHFANILHRSFFVITDSGGLQEEAPAFGKPVLVLREVTERPEAVEYGTARLIGTSQERIVQESVELIENKKAYERMSESINPFGDGMAGKRIVAGLLGEEFTPFDPF